ncbi:MAG: hypothetical protein V2A79_18055 [Planctomycetota bacterium]
MMPGRGLVLRWVGGFLLTAGGTAWGVGLEAQRVVVRRCVAILPPELSPLFGARVADLEERTLEPDGLWPRDDKLRGRAHWDHLWMDVKAEHGSLSARLAAADAFPRREADANELFKSLGFGKQGGRLPWALADLHAELVRAFQQGDADEIVKSAGYLTHFAWAASQPFSATMNHNGRDTGNLYLGDLEIGDPYHPHQSVHYRVMGELVRRYRNRYQDAVRVRPIELQPVLEPVEPCFHHMLGSLARLDDLLTADREITERLGAKDGAALAERQDEYYELLDARCGDIVAERLRSAALFAANLIAGAWERAGRPPVAVRDPHGVPTTTAPVEVNPAQAPRPAAPSTAPIPGGTYVGSKNSPIFHRGECAHVKRISPENRVTYASAEEALRQGKRPCRVCKPE